MHLTALLACVNYADFLRRTIASQRAAVDELIVVSAPNDTATRDACAGHDVVLLTTDAWWCKGAPFSKGAGLNVGMEYLRKRPRDWILSLDADIYLPPESYDYLHDTPLLQPVLYSAQRFMARTPQEFAQYLSTGSGLPLQPLPQVRHARVWGHRPTANPAGLQGYFQLWHITRGPERFLEKPTAAGYDVEFGLRWADALREVLPDYQVVHLGEERVNWAGRKSATW